MRILVVLDPLERLRLRGDSTYAIMLEAERRGHEVWTAGIGGLGLEHEDAIASARRTRTRLADTPSEAFTVEEEATIPLDAFQAVLMRVDPPVDVAYLQATWILERARGKTVLVNDPRALRELNEHLAVLRFPELTPPTVVTRSQDRLKSFLEEQGGAIVVKPIDGYGGLGVFMVRTGDPNTSAILENATQRGRAWTVAQRYLPEVTEGDKRILLVEGEAIGAVLRVPPSGELRGNLHLGARPVATELGDDDAAIVRSVGPFLRESGLIFAGIDVIGGRLTEINLTSPTGLRHLDALTGESSAARVLDAIERRATSRAPAL